MSVNKLMSLPVWTHRIAALASFGVMRLVQIRLDGLYAASGHPVDYATGQTTFDAARVKEFYAHMLDLGTLEIYVATQRFDFLFMAAVALFGLTFGTLVARTGQPGSWGRRLGFAAAGFAVTGALLDACENLVSFVMLANPLEFADWLALVYSGFAAAKFASMAFAMLLVLVSLAVSAAGRMTGRPALG